MEDPATGTVTAIDNLTYTYNTTNANSLQKVTDGTGSNYSNNGFRNYMNNSTTNYTYDANGNLLNDPYKGITFNAYNVLNKPDKETLTYNVTGSRYIEYIYDAGGSVLRKIAYDSSAGTTQTDYIDGFVYTNGTLAYFPSPEGRVLYNGSTYTNEYTIADQQGNARVSFNNTGTSGARQVVQENSYYGFGMVLPNSPVTGGSNKNLYNGGCEWQNDFQNQPDYYQTFYRNYDASTGRFIGIDPEPESTESMSVYQYAGNCPVMFNDPDGNYKSLPGTAPNPVVRYDSNYDALMSTITLSEQLAHGYDDIGGHAPYPTEGLFGSGGDSGGGAGGGVIISNPAVIADIFGAVKSGHDVSFNLDESGTYSVTYNNALINVDDPTDYAGGAGIITFGNYQTGPYGAVSTRLKNNSDNDNANVNSDFYDIGNKINAIRSGLLLLAANSKIVRASRVVEFASIPLFASAEVMDYFAWKSKIISGTKGLVNLGFGIAGLFESGAPVSALYFGVDAFYPGGWEGFGDDLTNFGKSIENVTMKGIQQYNSNFSRW